MTDSTNTFKDVQTAPDTSPVSALYDDIMSMNFESFKPNSTKTQDPEFLSMTPIFGAKDYSTVSVDNNDAAVVLNDVERVNAKESLKALADLSGLAKEKGDLLKEKKITVNFDGFESKLENRIADADRALENAPNNDRVIGKYEGFVQKLQKDIATRTSDIVQLAGQNLTAKEWKEFNKLGPVGIGKFGKHNDQPTVDLSNAQRAWLKEKHPEIYKKVEQLDGVNLQKSRAESGLRAAEDIRDQPVSTRLDYIEHLQKTHKMPDADVTRLLTEIARIPRSPQMEERFQSVARGTEAAWDGIFRRTIEQRGGNILDYVQRPNSFEQLRRAQQMFNPGAKQRH